MQVEEGEQPRGRETAYTKVSQVSGEPRSQLELERPGGAELGKLHVQGEAEGPGPAGSEALGRRGQREGGGQGGGATLSCSEVMMRDVSEGCSWSVRSFPAAFSRAQTTVLPSLPASSSPATPLFSPLLQPQARGPASRVPSPLCVGALRSSRVPPKRTGMEVPVLTAAVVVQACVWEEQDEPQQHPEATAARSFTSSLLPCLCLQTPEGTDQKTK